MPGAITFQIGFLILVSQINKWTKSGTSVPSQVRSLRKGNNDQVAISIDADQADQSGSLDEDDDKGN